MAHRSGNLLQFANSIFSQTFRSTPDVTEATRKFGERLAALGRTNLAVSRGGWSKTALRELAKETLEPFEASLTVVGPDVVLPAELCFDIGLIWHELSTKSAKYGSFSGAGGVVQIAWRIEAGPEGARTLVIDWIDGAVTPPKRTMGTCFGTKLLHSLVEGRFRGKIFVTLKPSYSCRIDIPL